MFDRLNTPLQKMSKQIRYYQQFFSANRKREDTDRVKKHVTYKYLVIHTKKVKLAFRIK